MVPAVAAGAAFAVRGSNDGSGRWSLSGQRHRHTQTSAATKTFNTYFSATFARSASGLITETNRVSSDGHQNGWSPYDVWLQFRPTTNPSGGVVPNPTCDPTSLVTQPFLYTNDQPNIAGTPTSGYFLPRVAYNVCVYYAHPSVLTLTGNGSATSTTITTAGTVLYAGTNTNALPNATVGLKVFHGYACATGTGFYTDPSYTTTDASGNYSKESGTPPGVGQYSAQTNVGSNLSNCINIRVDGVDEFALSLAITPNTVASGTVDPVTFSGTLTNPGGPTPVLGDVVTVTAFGTDSTCTTPVAWGPWTTTADASGHYATAPVPTTGASPGTYYYKASSMGVVSGCEHFTIA